MVNQYFHPKRGKAGTARLRIKNFGELRELLGLTATDIRGRTRGVAQMEQAQPEKAEPDVPRIGGADWPCFYTSQPIFLDGDVMAIEAWSLEGRTESRNQRGWLEHAPGRHPVDPLCLCNLLATAPKFASARSCSTASAKRSGLAKLAAPDFGCLS
jgi:hypothetical protein